MAAAGRSFVVWAFYCEKGDPNPLVDPIAMGVAIVVVKEEDGRVTCELHRSTTWKCFDGDTSKFYPDTRDFWKANPEKLEALRSDRTARDVFPQVRQSFQDADALAKGLGASFVPMTDRAEFDWVVLSVLSAKHGAARRTLPGFSADETLLNDPVDVGQMTAGFLLSAVPGFNPATDSVEKVFDRVFPCAEEEKPAWVKGNTHEPSEDAANIAWRYARLLGASSKFAADRERKRPRPEIGAVVEDGEEDRTRVSVAYGVGVQVIKGPCYNKF